MVIAMIKREFNAFDGDGTPLGWDSSPSSEQGAVLECYRGGSRRNNARWLAS
jgi:hypothetical protein